MSAGVGVGVNVVMLLGMKFWVCVRACACDTVRICAFVRKRQIHDTTVCARDNTYPNSQFSKLPDG